MHEIRLRAWPVYSYTTLRRTRHFVAPFHVQHTCIATYFNSGSPSATCDPWSTMNETNTSARAVGRQSTPRRFKMSRANSYRKMTPRIERGPQVYSLCGNPIVSIAVQIALRSVSDNTRDSRISARGLNNCGVGAAALLCCAGGADTDGVDDEGTY